MTTVLLLMAVETYFVIETIRLSFSDEVKADAEAAGLSDHVIRM